MNKTWFSMLAAALFLLPAFGAPVPGESTRTIRLIQDDAQVKMTTKMYLLKHLKATDLYIFIEAAVRRYSINSQVRALNFASAKKQFLIVTTAERFIPYVDQLISVLDRGTVKNEFNSSVYGTGYRWLVYQPKFRSEYDLMLPADVMMSGQGNVYAYNGVLWIKDDLDYAKYALEWVKYFDRPLPQATITLRYYVFRDSTLRDVGIDYLAWKNGPGMNLLDVAYSAGKVSWNKILNTAAALGSSATWAYGGCFTAPAFDMSFIRLLQQSGEANIVATATVNVINNQDLASVSLSPVYNNQIKNEDFASLVVPSEVQTDFQVQIRKPTICFHTEKSEVSDMGWIPSDKAFYDKNKGCLVFGYSLTSTDATEANNNGLQVRDTFSTDNNLKTIDLGREQVLAQMVREHDVEQTTGVPFLCQLPILKYIFGTTTTMKEKIYLIVTMEARLVYPGGIAKK